MGSKDMYRTKANERYQTAVDSMLNKYRVVMLLYQIKQRWLHTSWKKKRKPHSPNYSMTSARGKRTEEKTVEISLASSMMTQPTFTRERDISTERHAWYAALSEIARLHHDYNLTRPRIYGNASVALSHWKPFHHKQIWSVHHTLSGNMFSCNEQSQYEIMSLHYNDQSPFQYIKHGHAQSPHWSWTVVIAN